MRRIYMALLTLAMLSLTACGAAPQAAAPTENPTAAGDALATAVPAATADPADAPTETQTAAPPTATPQEDLVPRTTPTVTTQPPTASPTPQLTLSTTRPTPAVDRVPTPEAAPAVVGEVPAELMDKILADAAQLSGVNAASIIVQMSQAVEWPDGSLGCPKPGVAYLQVITSGYHVILLAGATTYDYRADGRGRFFVCKA